MVNGNFDCYEEEMNENTIFVNGVPIRLNAERWMHITMGHPEVADYYYEILQTLEIPGTVYAGGRGKLLAVRALPDSNGKNLIVVYKLLSIKRLASKMVLSPRLI